MKRCKSKLKTRRQGPCALATSSFWQVQSLVSQRLLPKWHQTTTQCCTIRQAMQMIHLYLASPYVYLTDYIKLYLFLQVGFRQYSFMNISEDPLASLSGNPSLSVLTLYHCWWLCLVVIDYCSWLSPILDHQPAASTPCFSLCFGDRPTNQSLADVFALVDDVVVFYLCSMDAILLNCRQTFRDA